MGGEWVGRAGGGWIGPGAKRRRDEEVEIESGWEGTERKDEKKNTRVINFLIFRSSTCPVYFRSFTCPVYFRFPRSRHLSDPQFSFLVFSFSSFPSTLDLNFLISSSLGSWSNPTSYPPPQPHYDPPGTQRTETANFTRGLKNQGPVEF